MINDKFFFWRLVRRISSVAYKYRGFARIADSIRQVIARYTNSDYLISNYGGHLLFKSRLNDHIGSYIFWKGTYSGHSLEWLNFLLRANGVFIDIGANQGEFTLRAAKILTQGKVYAFEPADQIRDRLLENISLNNFTNIKIFSCGLGDKRVKLPLYAAPKRFKDGTFHNGLETLFQSETRNELVGEIDIEKLDDIAISHDINECSLIKIDTEGSEFSILTGAQNFIKKTRPALIIEFHSTTCRNSGHSIIELYELIVSLGYKIYEQNSKGDIEEFTKSRALNLTDDECINVLAIHESSRDDFVKMISHEK
jgi:FkbM family methyltransferase